MTEQRGLSPQTGEAMEFVADLSDISRPDPKHRNLSDPHAAADIFKAETLSRVEAVLRAHPGTPVVLLSGGVDSILVAAAAVELGAHPRAITVVTDGGTDKANASAAAAALGLIHHIVELSDQDVAELARKAMAELEVTELWEVSYAIPLLATLPVLDEIGDVGPILTGSGADAIVAGGKVLAHPVGSPEAVEELDQAIRKESAHNFRYERFVPDFYPRVMGRYADHFIHVFQTRRFWDVAETFAPPALFGENNGQESDKLCVRIACEALLPENAKLLAWAKKSAIQKSAGIMGSLAGAARRFAAALPGAQTYTDPMTESYEAVASRLFLALLRDGSTSRPVEPKPIAADDVTKLVAQYAPDGEDWREPPNWRKLDAWLDVARQHGLEPAVLEITDSHYVVGVVQVAGRQYDVRHLGRRMELQAAPR